MGQKGRTVLVVDDDRINRSLLSKLLEHEGYEARTAVNGREALAALAEESFDAVLLDIVMPEVDGMEVLRTLKGDPRLWWIPGCRAAGSLPACPAWGCGHDAEAWAGRSRLEAL